jgi:hydroxyacylglutathione hydrolase
MKIEQIYTGCLAQGAYYIESNGEVAIIDPLRDTQVYIDKSKLEGAQIKYIFETHFHADFVSGHVDLAEQTGAKIIFGPNASTEYKSTTAFDGQEFKLGNISLVLLHTPGHTMESSTILLKDENGKDHAIFTGDTLFIGDVGRPDLAVKSDLTQEDLASHLFDSLRLKIMPLADEVIVYPAHGAGSACGKNLSKNTFDTLGNQKATNYALRSDMSREEFIKEVLDGLSAPPQYFAENVRMNKHGYDSLEDVLTRGVVALTPEAFEKTATAERALVLDTRTPEVFKDAFIPNSINIGIDGGFAPWVGALIPDLKQSLLIVTDEGREEEVITRLARVGYDNTIGYLDGGIVAWIKSGKEIDSIVSISAEQFESELSTNSDIKVLDVRKPGEYTAEHIEGVENYPLDNISLEINKLNTNDTYHIHCGGGYRSMIMASILKSRGFDHVIDVAGGFAAIKNTSIRTTAYVCPSTLK